MQIPEWNPIDEEELKGAPAWARPVFEKISSQIESITQALKGNATLAENSAAEVIEVVVKHGEAARVELSRLLTPIGVAHLDNAAFKPATAVMQKIDEGVVEVIVRFAEDPGEEVNTRLVFYGA